MQKGVRYLLTMRATDKGREYGNPNDDHISKTCIGLKKATKTHGTYWKYLDYGESICPSIQCLIDQHSLLLTWLRLPSCEPRLLTVLQMHMEKRRASPILETLSASSVLAGTSSKNACPRLMRAL